MISDFNGGDRNGKNVIRLAVYAFYAWRFLFKSLDTIQQIWKIVKTRY
jgi:hypothetical protein